MKTCRFVSSQSKQGQWRTKAIALLFLSFFCAVPVISPSSAFAAPRAQASDPVQQCAKGIELFLSESSAEALSLLEAGFENRSSGDFTDPKVLGDCALLLGILYYRMDSPSAALVPFSVALEVYEGTGDKWLEAVTLNNLGSAQKSIGQMDEALKQLDEALEIERDLADRDGEGATQSNIGGVYHLLGSFDEAISHYEAALAIFREAGNRAGESTVLGNIGQVLYAQGRYDDALTYYEHAVTISREVENRPGEASILRNIGSVFYSLGRYADALDFFERALAIHQELGDLGGEATTLNSIGLVFYSRGQNAEALEYYEQALSIEQKIHDRFGEGATLNNIGTLYQAQGRYVEGLQYLEQALTLRRDVGDRAGEAATLGNIGVVLYEQGRYEEALEYHQQALVLARDVGDRVGEAKTLSNIGLVLYSQGRMAQALEYFRQTLLIQSTIGDRVGQAITLNNIGLVFDSQGRFPEALEYFEQSLSLQREVNPTAEEGTTLNNIGLVLLSQGIYAEAIDSFEQALIAVQEVGDLRGQGTTLDSIGLVFQRQGRHAEALTYYERALAIQQEIGDREAESTTLSDIGTLYEDSARYEPALSFYEQALKLDREIGNRNGEGRNLGNIGAIHHRNGSFPVALDYYQQAIDVFETVRAGAGSESGRSSFIGQYAGLYGRVVELLMRQDLAEQAFLTTERGRARAFLDSLSTGYVELGDDDSAALYNREYETYTVLQAAQDALTRAKAQNPVDEKLIADLEVQREQAEADHRTALDSITSRGAQLVQLVPGRSTVLDVAQAQDLIDDQTTVVSYWLLDDQTLAFILTNSTFDVVSLPVSTADLSAQVEALRAFANTSAAHPESAVSLYRMLIEPLKPHLLTPHLVVVPHNVLHYLPFAALTDGKRYLIDDYTLSYLPSVTSWKFIGGSGGHAVSNALVLGNPSTSNSDFSSLPFAERESLYIASLYGATALLGMEATESILYERSDEARVLHLAAHASYSAVNPLYSTIYLAPDDQNDGHLETREIYRLPLQNADLVVLSACETQLGAISSGDEVVSLTRAFLYAGSPTVVASLWAVDDRATELLMEKFYAKLNSGAGKAEALRQAQLEVRADYPNPYYWAAFVLNGDPGK